MTAKFVFPRALSHLDYADRLHESDRKAVALDARSAVRRYCESMNLGMAYQQFIYGHDNIANSYKIARANFQNARNVHSMGWSYADFEDVFTREWQQLRFIPVNADLFQTSEYDEAAIEVLVELSQRPGISISNATKLLHQKRPGLVPVLDTYARLSMDVTWVRGSGRHADAEAYRLGFARCRETIDHASNRAVLIEVQSWLTREHSLSQDLPFTHLRLLDILAWMNISSPGS